MEELVDSWDFKFSYDFILFHGHIHGIIHADAACKCRFIFVIDPAYMSDGSVLVSLFILILPFPYLYILKCRGQSQGCSQLTKIPQTWCKACLLYQTGGCASREVCIAPLMLHPNNQLNGAVVWGGWWGWDGRGLGPGRGSDWWGHHLRILTTFSAIIVLHVASQICLSLISNMDLGSPIGQAVAQLR